MKAIILAAGAGRRLGLEGPKSMVDIAGQSIIHRQLAAFRAAGVDRFVIVVGHEQRQLRDHLTDQAGVFTYIVNKRYAETNTVYSLYLARDQLAGGFYYANADVVFDRRLVEQLRDADVETALAVETAHCAEEEVKVIVRDGKVVQIGKKLDPADCLGEFVGVARFGAPLAPAFVEALEYCVETEGEINDYFERAVDRLCADHTLSPIDISDLPCVEIDFPDDLERARTNIAPRLVQ